MTIELSLELARKHSYLVHLSRVFELGPRKNNQQCNLRWGSSFVCMYVYRFMLEVLLSVFESTAVLVDK